MTVSNPTDPYPIIYYQQDSLREASKSEDTADYHKEGKGKEKVASDEETTCSQSTASDIESEFSDRSFIESDDDDDDDLLAAIESYDFEKIRQELGDFPLHYVIEKGLNYLIAPLCKKYDINAYSNEGETPLHVAIRCRLPRTLNELLKHGVDPFKPATNLLFPIGYAVYLGSIACLDALAAFEENQLGGIGPYHDNVLHIAIRSDQERALKHLLTFHSMHVKPLVERKNAEHLTPFMLAAKLGKPNAAALLFRYGDADLEKKDTRGCTALHLSIIADNSPETIELLDYLDADFNARTDEGDDPFALARLFHARQAQTQVKNIMSRRKNAEHYPPNYNEKLPWHCIFKGGGIKTTAYVGALEELDRHGLLNEWRHVVGTSAGSLVAALTAIGYSPAELSNILEEAFENMLDPLIKTNKKESRKKFWSVIRVIANLIKKIAKVGVRPDKAFKYGNPIFWLKEVFGTRTGFFKGEKFRNWLEDRIYQKTGIPHCTFAELHSLVKQGLPFKDLYVFATRIIKETPELARFSYEDPLYQDVPISEAVFASCAVPGIFMPWTLVLKDAEGVLHRHENSGSFFDGGVAYNMAVECCDKERYVHPGLSKKLGNRPIKDSRSLIFELCNPKELAIEEFSKEKIGTVKKEIKSIYDLFRFTYAAYESAQQMILSQTESAHGRVIRISNEGVGLLSTKLSPKKKKAIVKSGKKAAASFLGMVEVKVSPLQKALKNTEGMGEMDDRESAEDIDVRSQFSSSEEEFSQEVEESSSEQEDSNYSFLAAKNWKLATKSEQVDEVFRRGSKIIVVGSVVGAGRAVYGLMEAIPSTIGFLAIKNLTLAAYLLEIDSLKQKLDSKSRKAASHIKHGGRNVGWGVAAIPPGIGTWLVSKKEKNKLYRN